MNYIYILLITELMLLLFIMAITKMDYTSPSFITVSMYFLSTLCVIYNIDYWDVSFSFHAFSLIILGLCTLTFTEIIVLKLTYRNKAWTIKKELKPIIVSSGTLLIFNTATFLMMLCFVLHIMWLGGGGLKSISVVKFADNLRLSALAKACLRISKVQAYPCLYIFLYNRILFKYRLRQNIGILLPVLFSGIVILFSGSRGSYIYMVFAAVIYIIMIDRMKNGWTKINIKKYVKPLLITIIAFLAIFFGTKSIVKNYEISDTFLQYITYYFGSPVHLLSKLLTNPHKAYPKTYSVPGANVFVSFFEELHKWGVFNEEIHLGQTGFMYIGGQVEGGGNAYTMFGSVYNDFGYIGALIFIAVEYGIINSIYYKKIKNRKDIVHIDWIILLYGYFSYMLFMNFYVNTVIYLKFQTILEVMVMLSGYWFLKKCKVKC